MSWLKSIWNEIITYPAAIAGGLGAVLAYAVSQGIVSWSQDQVAVVGGVVTAVLALVAGIATKRFGVALVIALGNALGAAILGFDTSLSAKHVAALLAVVTFGLGLIHHTQNSPKYGTAARGLPLAQQVGAPVSNVPGVAQREWSNQQDVVYDAGTTTTSTGAVTFSGTYTNPASLDQRVSALEQATTPSVRDTKAFPDAAALRAKRSAAAKKGAATKAAKKATETGGDALS